MDFHICDVCQYNSVAENVERGARIQEEGRRQGGYNTRAIMGKHTGVWLPFGSVLLPWVRLPTETGKGGGGAAIEDMAYGGRTRR